MEAHTRRRQDEHSKSKETTSPSGSNDERSDSPFISSDGKLLDQRLVAQTGILILIFDFCLVFGLYTILPLNIPPLPTVGERIAYCIKWNLISACMILAGVRKIMRTRLNSRAFDPISGNDQKLVEVHVRYLQNTLEQFVLSFVGWYLMYKL